MRTAQLDLRGRTLQQVAVGLAAINLVFTAGTALFIHFWAVRESYGRRGRVLIDYVLLQFHLATENVVASWYSSMLLLTVALAAAVAFSLDRRHERSWIERLLGLGWLLVAAAFAGLSLDEIGSLHERLGMVRYGGAPPTGWVYTLFVPIAMVGVFLLMFAWFIVRRSRAAALLFVAGVTLFLINPFFELAEMSVLHGGGDIAVHNALMVVEEGLLELGGTLCFLLGVLLYIRRVEGAGPHVFDLRSRRAVVVMGVTAALLAAGVPTVHWFVARLPGGDTGVPDNWFPAAALFLFALAVSATRGWRAAPIAVAALGLSAAFGAALFGYTGWFPWIGYPGPALDTAVTAVASVAAIRAVSYGSQTGGTISP